MKTIVMIPTYNETSNIKRTIDNVLNYNSDVEVLIVDDMSPDETYKTVEEIAKKNNRVHLLLRKKQKGRGYAGKEGFIKALEMGAEYIVEMDGDGSHCPKHIPAFEKIIENCDVVIGSRYVEGGKDEERSFLRRVASTFSRRYLSFVLGLNVKDPTSGYRMFKRKVLEKFAEDLMANDTFIITEVLYQVKKNHFIVKECPIIFLERFSGESKLDVRTLIKYLFKVLKLKIIGK